MAPPHSRLVPHHEPPRPRLCPPFAPLLLLVLGQLKVLAQRCVSQSGQKVKPLLANSRGRRRSWWEEQARTTGVDHCESRGRKGRSRRQSVLHHVIEGRVTGWNVLTVSPVRVDLAEVVPVQLGQVGGDRGGHRCGRASSQASVTPCPQRDHKQGFRDPTHQQSPPRTHPASSAAHRSRTYPDCPPPSPARQSPSTCPRPAAPTPSRPP